MATARKTATPRRKTSDAANDAQSDSSGTQYLETLLGYNARRASLTLIDSFIQSMTDFDLRTVDFSVLSVIRHQPGVTSRQLCHLLNVLPPNMVGVLRQLEQRGLIERKPHPTDGRAVGLSLSAAGRRLIDQAEAEATQADLRGSARLSAAERKTLARLLQKVYLPA